MNYNTGTSGTTTFIVYICGLHVSIYTQVIFRPSCTRQSIKSYARWDPIVLTSLKHTNYIKILIFFEVRHPRCVSNKSNVMCTQYVVKHNLALDGIIFFYDRQTQLTILLTCALFKYRVSF